MQIEKEELQAEIERFLQIFVETDINLKDYLKYDVTEVRNMLIVESCRFIQRLTELGR